MTKLYTEIALYEAADLLRTPYDLMLIFIQKFLKHTRLPASSILSTFLEFECSGPGEEMMTITLDLKPPEAGKPHTSSFLENY